MNELIQIWEREKKLKKERKICCPYEGCSKSWKNIHNASVRAHISFKCSFIKEGESKIAEFYAKQKKPFYEIVA